MENWTYIKQKIAKKTNFYLENPVKDLNLNENYLDTGDAKESSNSRLLQNLFFNPTEKNILKSRLLQSTDVKMTDKPLPQTKETAPDEESTKNPLTGIESNGRQANDVTDILGGKTDLDSKIHNDTAKFAKDINTKDHLAITFAETKFNKTHFDSTIKNIATEEEVRTPVVPPIVTNKPAHQDQHNSILFPNSTSNEFINTFNGTKNESITVNHLKHSTSSENQDFSAMPYTKTRVMKNVTQESSSSLENGYLVYSKQCRIPDIDPMDSSIVHLISKTPPLDCSVSAIF